MAIKQKFGENGALNFLSQNESFSGYQRKRLAHFLKQNQVHNEKKHRITDSFVEEYKDIILEKLMEWPSEKLMNWSELGRQCGLTVPNMGQKVKEVAIESGIDVTLYVGSSKSCSSRLSKSYLPGNEISIPSMPTIATLREDVNHLLDSGELTMGGPCSPYMVVRSSVHVYDGKLVSTPSQIYGRKIPLLELRPELLKKQEQFMHLNTDEHINSLSLEEVKSRLHLKSVILMPSLVPRCSNLEEGRGEMPGTHCSAHALNFREISEIGYLGNFPCNGDIPQYSTV